MKTLAKPAQAKWSKGTFKITGTTDKPIRSGTIHPSGMFAIESGQTRVTHVPTGLFISKLPFTHTQAKAYANSLANLEVDWSTLTNDNAIGFKVEGKLLPEVLLQLAQEIISHLRPITRLNT